MSRIPRLDRARYGQLRLAITRLDLDVDRFRVDLDELRDHFRDLFTHLLQPAAVEAGAIVREHEVKAAFRDLARWLADEETLEVLPHRVFLTPATPTGRARERCA